MFHRTALALVSVLVGACASVQRTPGQTVSTASQVEPIVAFMDIGGVT